MVTTEPLTPEQGYAQLLVLSQCIRKTCAEMEPHYEYSPFKYLSGEFERPLEKIRTELIMRAVEKYRKQYTPNYHPEIDFVKELTRIWGDKQLHIQEIEEWFKIVASNTEQLEKDSYDELLGKAKHFLRYMENSDGHYGACDDWTKIVDKPKGVILNLHCYTWSGASSYTPGSLNYSINDKGQLNALEKLIDIVTLGFDARDNSLYTPWLSPHYSTHRKDSEGFYGKHEVEHPTVVAFQFFKNSKFMVWFKSAEYAEAVARALAGEKVKVNTLG